MSQRMHGKEHHFDFPNTPLETQLFNPLGSYRFQAQVPGPSQWPNLKDQAMIQSSLQN